MNKTTEMRLLLAYISWSHIIQSSEPFHVLTGLVPAKVIRLESSPKRRVQNAECVFYRIKVSNFNGYTGC